MPAKSRPGVRPSLAAGATIGLPGSIVVAVLLAWRLKITAWEAVQTSCQVFLFSLGCWLLPKNNHSQVSGRYLLSLVGSAFTALRFINYARALLAPSPIPQYEVLFRSTAFGYAITGLYAAESTFMQMLLHGVLPAWACSLIGALQAFLFACINFRYVAAQDVSLWLVLRVLTIPQVGMFAPYHLTRRWLQRTAVQPPLPGKDKAIKQQHTAEGPTADQSASDAKVDTHAEVNNSLRHASAASSSSRPLAVDTAGLHARVFAHKVVSSYLVPRRGSRVPSLSSSGWDHGSISKAHWNMGLLPALHLHAYKDYGHTSHMVCIKLDTEVSCDCLPQDAAQVLQASINENMQVTSRCTHAVLCVSNVAVRPGCMTITMKLEEHLLWGAPSQDDSTPTSIMHSKDLAHVMLPELQRMLTSPGNALAFVRATVQLDDELVISLWQEKQPSWDCKLDTRLVPQSPSETVWLGVATAMQLQSSAASSSTLSQPQSGCLDLLVDIQLWGVSKVADVEGWDPAPYHNPVAASAWFLTSIAKGGSDAPFRLLAQTAGGYLPTQVVRLVPGSTDGYVTAQVLVQLHEHQLVRHHEGGSPSTLLLMDLELWQNEVLLSSSPLLSVPTPKSNMALEPTTPTAWWWGAADSTVAAALAETEQCCQECMAAATEECAPAAIQTYVQYMQDLGTWLSQVQRAARDHQLCCMQPPTVQSGVVLQQPTLPIMVLQQLGEQLQQYAETMGWHQTRRMLMQQVRSVVQPAASRSAQTSQHRDAAAVLQPATTRGPRSGACGVWALWLRAARVLFLGYPCRHDEQLYKQQLAVHLSGVQIVSSIASLMIGVLWRGRVGNHPITAVIASVWTVLHFMAVVTLLRARARQSTLAGKQLSGIPSSTPTQHTESPITQTHVASAPRAMQFVRVAYIWRNVIRAAWAALAVFAGPPDIHAPLYQHAWFWVMLHSVLVLTEQVPASAALSGPWVTGLVLVLEFPAATHDIIRATGAHVGVAMTTALVAVLSMRLVMEWQMRKHVLGQVGRALKACPAGVRDKTD